MDYQKLKGKEVTLNGRKIHVEKIREIDGLYANTYEINNDYTYSSDAIFGALLEIEAQERSGENLGFFAKILMKFGLFFFKVQYLNQRRFGMPLGIREYGYKKNSVFVELMLGKSGYVLEFVFNNKNVYKTGAYPKEAIELKKVV